MPKVTVYIPSHNYARFLDQAVQSVFKQTMDDWELIIIDDGSTDNTVEVLERYRDRPKIRVVEQDHKGLNVTNNIALRLSSGQYLIRLDADDYLDENILLVLSNVLDTKPEVGLVYPDYYLVNEDAKILDLVRRKKVGEEVELLDLPAHGACTIIRKKILLQLGGYREEFNRQDGYDLWVKFIQRHNPYNVNVPLFYYRQHGKSLTTDQGQLHKTRSQIKRRFVAESKASSPKVLAIVPVVTAASTSFGAPFTKLAGKALIDYALEAVQRAALVDRVAVSAGGGDVMDHVAKYPGILGLRRPKELTYLTSPIEKTVEHVLDVLARDEGYEPDAVCVCYINHPFRTAEHIDAAIDTMTIFGVDSVISIQEELSFCYHHGRHGLAPINGSLRRNLRLERDAIFKENGAIYLTRTAVLRRGRLLGDRIGHITMLPEESVSIKSELDFWLAEKIAGELNVR